MAEYINWTVMVSHYWLLCLDINLVRCFSTKCRKFWSVWMPSGVMEGRDLRLCVGQMISCLETTTQFPQMVREDNLKTSWTVSTERKRLCLELHTRILILLFQQYVLGGNYRQLCDWWPRGQIWPLVEFYPAIWFDFDETLDIRALSVQNSLASLEALRSQLVIRGPNSVQNGDI